MRRNSSSRRSKRRVGDHRILRLGLLAVVGLAAAVLLARATSVGDTPVAVAATSDPVIAAAGDIACDPASSSFNGGNGSSNSCRQKHVSDLLLDPELAAVLPLGDNQYYCGSYQAFLQSYDPSWGRVKSITRPAVGNHEYLTSGGTGCDSTNTGAAGYYNYFGAAAGDPSKGYYSYDLGTWHMIVLNSNCSRAGGCSASTPQGQWLRADLAAHSNFCTLAYWHTPVFSSGGRDSATYTTFWDALYEADADVILNAHDHLYERFAPQTPNGVADPVRGIREFVVGTGGSNHTSFTNTIFPNSEVRNDTTYGVLKLTLHPTSYDWEFVPEAGKTFRDSGSGACHGAEPDTVPPTKPTGLAGAALGGSKVDLSWTASTDDIGVEGYQVLRDGVQIGTSPTASYSDTTVAPNTTYTYVVRAFDHGGNSSPDADPVDVTTGPPDQQLLFTASDDAYIESTLPNANSGSATSIDVDGSPVKNLLVKFALSGLAGRQVVDAKLRLYDINASGFGGTFSGVSDQSWSEGTVTWANAPSPSAAVASLDRVSTNTWYEVDVTSLVSGDGPVSIRGSSASSDGADYASKEFGSGFAPQLVVTVAGEAVPDAAPPTQPTGLQAVAVSSSAVNLSWNESSDDVGVTGYDVFRNGTKIATAPTNSYPDLGLQPSTLYTYTVVARDASGKTSLPSDPAAATTPAGSSTLTFTPTADATVRSDMPAGNFGAAASLETDNRPVKDFLLTFDVSGVGGRQVTSAQLRLYCLDSSNRGGDIRRVAAPGWNESTVTWSSAPPGDLSPVASLGQVSTGTWYTVNVTPIVAGDGLVSVRVTSTSSNGADFSSKEGAAGFVPELVVTTQ